MPRTLTLDYDDEAVTYQVEGDTAWGDDHVLLLQDDDLTAACEWAASGFTVRSFLDRELHDTLVTGVHGLLADAIRRAGITVPADFALEKYHLTVDTDEAHRRVFELTPGCFPIQQFPIPAALVDDRVSV